MATAITPITPAGPYPATLPVTALSLDFVWTAADVAGNTFTMNNDALLLIWNSGASPYTVTITSVATGDPFNRTGDITAYSVTNALYSMFRLKAPGWKNPSGLVTVTANNAGVKFAFVNLG